MKDAGKAATMKGMPLAMSCNLKSRECFVGSHRKEQIPRSGRPNGQLPRHRIQLSGVERQAQRGPVGKKGGAVSAGGLPPGGGDGGASMSHTTVRAHTWRDYQAMDVTTVSHGGQIARNRTGGYPVPRRGVLEKVVHSYVQGLGDSGQRLDGASSLSRLNLGKVNSIDAGRGGQLTLGHMAMAAIHPDWILPCQELVCHFNGKGLASLSLGTIVKLHIAQQRLGIFLGQALIFQPGNHRKSRLSGSVKNDLGLIHHILLSSVDLSTWGDAEHVNNQGSVVPLKNDPQVAYPQAKAGSPGKWGYIQLPAVGVLGQLVQLTTDALSLLTRHLLQSSYSLSLKGQLVQPFFHVQYYSIALYICQAYCFSLLSAGRWESLSRG